MELHEGHEGYTNPDPYKRASWEIPTGWLHAVRPGADVSLCTEDSLRPLHVTDSGRPWQPSRFWACRECRQMASPEA